MKAYAMINLRLGSIFEAFNNLREIGGVMEANMTFITYDIISAIEAEDIQKIGRMIATKIQPIPGIQDSLTCLVIES